MELFKLIHENLTSVFVFFITLAIVYFYHGLRRKHGVPPGPRRFPIVGNLGSLIGKDTINILANLRMKYGDIYGLYFGTKLTIFLNGYDVIHDALVKRGTLFSRRPLNTLKSPKVREWVAIALGNGAAWKEFRIFTLNTLRDLCFRKTGCTLEHRITEELTCFTKELSKCPDEDVDVSRLISFSLANVMYSILHGRRIGYADAKFNWFMDELEKSFRRHVSSQALGACFPYFRYLPGDLLHMSYAENYYKELVTYFKEICRVNFRNYKPGNNNCFIDYWIAAAETNPMFQKENLWVVLHDLMAAGSETSATTLKWVILALVSYPEIQTKLQRKVDEVIKRGEVPSFTDKVNLPYVEAVILEALRIGSAVPLSLPHAVSRDTEFRGFKLSTEDTIIPNLTSVHFDSDIFPDPDVFKPERFLDKAGTTIVGMEKLIPFSLGPRSCIGETLARMELFLYVTTLGQTLEFRAPESAKLPSFRGIFGITHHPKEFKVNVRVRS